MPSRCTFSSRSIILRMFMQLYGEDAGAFDIRTGTLIDGGLPARASDLVREWIVIHRSELLEMWETQEFRKLDPLA